MKINKKVLSTVLVGVLSFGIGFAMCDDFNQKEISELQNQVMKYELQQEFNKGLNDMQEKINNTNKLEAWSKAKGKEVEKRTNEQTDKILKFGKEIKERLNKENVKNKTENKQKFELL